MLIIKAVIPSPGFVIAWGISNYLIDLEKAKFQKFFKRKLIIVLFNLKYKYLPLEIECVTVGLDRLEHCKKKKKQATIAH